MGVLQLSCLTGDLFNKRAAVRANSGHKLAGKLLCNRISHALLIIAPPDRSAVPF